MKFLFFFSFVLFSYLASGQAVKVEPTRPTSDKEITLTIDLNLAADPRAKKLLKKTDDVYLWSGAGDSVDGNPFKYQPKDQVDFFKPYEGGKMTNVGDNLWRIKLIPRKYFAVPDSLPIKKLGLLLKSGNGRSQTEDFTIEVFDN